MISVAKDTRSCDILSLQRDSLLLQFLIGFLINAPLTIIHLYQSFTVIASDDEFEWVWPLYHVTLCSFGVAILSLLVTLVSYIAHDRLHSEKRRVVFPGHLTAFVWHVCIVAGRIMALSLFATAFGPYVVIVIGIHWISCIVWACFEKTNICGDVTATPPRKRLYLELPFILVISFVYLFVYFNIRDGSTRVRIMIYHTLTSVETLVLPSLFYAVTPSFPYSLWLLAGTVSVYVMGVALMLLYYSAWHPNRTKDCFMTGIPHSCDCCHLFYKLSNNETYNVDQSLDEEHADGSITLTNYTPMTNLSVLTERPSTYTIGSVSRSVRATPTGTPQHRVRGASTPNRVPRRSSRIRPGTRMEYLSSTPNIANNARRMSVSNIEMRPVSPSMRSRSYSEDVGLRLEPSSGIGQLSAIKRPTSESIDSPIFKHLTPTRRPNWHQKRALRNSQFNQPSSSSGQHVPDRPSMLLTSEVSSQVTPLHTTSALTTPTHINKAGRYSFHNYSGTVVLPSPIGEEPMSSMRGANVSPVVVQVNGISYPDDSVIQNGRSSVEPVYTRLYPPQRNHSHKYSDVNYTELTPARTVKSMYIDMPTHRTRRRSLSPVQSTGKLNGRTSPNYRSTNCTPKASPHPGRGHRNPSNPLHSHDPMKEFTRLYSTKHKEKTTVSNPATGESRVLSTSSSYIVSSDNHSDTDMEEPATKTTPTHVRATPTHIMANANSLTTLQPVVTMTTKHNRASVTAHRQNSDEFLTTNLHNVNGTLV